MKLLTFIKNGQKSLGVKTEEGIVDLAQALMEHPEANIPTEVMEAVRMDKAELSALESYVSRLSMTAEASYVLHEDEVEWGPCVTEPSKIICVGLNYRQHADETNSPYPEVPILFNKFSNSLAPHHGEVTVPKVTDKLDYEVELCMVIGKTTKDVTTEDALQHVFGYCTANDLSARDLQKRTSQWMIGKACDGFCPVGPYLVTADEVGDPQNLQLKTYVNGEERQNSNTADMIFSCAEIISFISQHMTLKPGDLILTGTPAGVVMGLPRAKQVYIKPGDSVTVEVEKLGSLTNTFV